MFNFKKKNDVNNRLLNLYGLIADLDDEVDEKFAKLGRVIDKRVRDLQVQIDELKKAKEAQETEVVEVDEHFVMYKEDNQRRYKLTDTTKDLLNNYRHEKALSMKNLSKEIGIGITTLYSALGNGGVKYSIMLKIKTFLSL